MRSRNSGAVRRDKVKDPKLLAYSVVPSLGYAHGAFVNEICALVLPDWGGCDGLAVGWPEPEPPGALEYGIPAEAAGTFVTCVVAHGAAVSARGGVPVGAFG